MSNFSAQAVNEMTPVTASYADFSSLVTTLFSLSALRDWIKLFVIGGVIETCRRLALIIWNYAVDSLFVVGQFRDGDQAYNWMMVWLSKQPSWSSARIVQISTRKFGLDSPAIIVPGEEDMASYQSSRPLSYTPAISSAHSFFYRYRWVSVTRQKESLGYYGQVAEILQVRILCRNRSLLDAILLEAKREYKAAEENTISIWTSDSSHKWKHVISRPKRPLRSIMLDLGVKDVLLNDARDFLESKSWYAERGIPFRRGYLLHGVPGSGKTSIIHGLAGELGLNIYVVSLSKIGIDDTSLSELISDMPEKCIALMEDIDAAFHHGVTRESTTGAGGQSDEAPEEQKKKGAISVGSSTSSRVTLSGLLNALDGIAAQEGRILFATTNKYTALDPALCRPGRMDLHVEFKLSSKYQASELFKCFYLPSYDVDNVDDDEGEQKSLDSGYSSFDSPTGALIDLDSLDEKLAPPVLTDSDLTSPLSSASTCIIGSTHCARGPRLTHGQAADLAAQFADAIPEREFSMASLQGYLMTYKSRPFDAIQNASAWVEKEREERAVGVKTVASEHVATGSFTALADADPSI